MTQNKTKHAFLNLGADWGWIRYDESSEAREDELYL